jgi:hypothetical protein
VPDEGPYRKFRPRSELGDFLQPRLRFGLRRAMALRSHLVLLPSIVKICDRRDEPVAPPGNGLDEGGIFGGIAQSVSEFLDCSVQALVEVDVSPTWPQAGAQFFSADHFARMFQQNAENLQRLMLQVNQKASLEKLSPRKDSTRADQSAGGIRVWKTLSPLSAPLRFDEDCATDRPPGYFFRRICKCFWR